VPKRHSSQLAVEEVVKSRLVGNWELTEPLGRGGQGTTWRAIWREKGASLTKVGIVGGSVRRSVVKLMLPAAPEDVPIPSGRFDSWLEAEAAEFLREAMVLSKLDNPFIPAVFQAQRQKTKAGWSVPWFATELINGRSLAQQIGSQGPMDQNQLLDLAHDILSALEAIHAADLVHLDLKPDNVMLEPGKALLIDFGLVSKANRKGRFGGTSGFFSPEQLDEVIEEQDFAPATDIFKLGVTLAIAAGVRLADLWGVNPASDNETLRRAISRGPALGKLGPVAKDLILPMLSFDPSKRPSAELALKRVRKELPEGNAKSAGPASVAAIPGPSVAQPARDKGERPVVKRRNLVPRAAPGPADGANVGAKVVVVDRLGLDWAGIVVGLDSRKPGNVLIKHDSARGKTNVQSYPLQQVVRGRPVK
jgi:serine/threonine protein kinase